MFTNLRSVKPDQKKSCKKERVQKQDSGNVNDKSSFYQNACDNTLNYAGDERSQTNQVGINYLPDASATFKMMATIGSDKPYKFIAPAQPGTDLYCIKRL